MTIQSDSFGFLVGDPADWGEALKLWAAILDDVRGIRQALTSSAAAAKRATQSSTAPALALPRRQSAAAAKVVQITSRAVVQPTSLLKTAVVSKDVLRAAFPTTVRRDANGRFVRTDRAITPNAPRAGQDQPSERNGKGDSTDGRSAVSGRIGAVGSMASNAIDRAPDVDPAIAAAKELSAIVTPVGRGFGKMLGRDGEEKKKVIWFKRLWTELRGLRRDETEFNKAQLRKLAAIEKKPAAGSSSGGLLNRLASKIPGLGMLGNLLGKGGKGLFGLGKGAFRRLPLLGAMLAGGSALASMFDSDDPDKTQAENRKGRFVGAGSGIGALIGGGIGLAFGGPIGAMIGGFIGDKLGEVTGEWLSTFDWKEIGGKITATWDAGVQKFSDGWDAITGFFKDKFDIARNAANVVKDLAVQAGNAANEVVKEKTGVDVKTNVTNAATAVKNTAVAAVETVDQHVVKPVTAAAGAAANYGQERVAKMAAPIGRVVNERWQAAKDYLVGGASSAGVDPGVVAQIAHFESGFNKDAAPIQKNGKKLSSAHGYGQFIDGTWTDMINKYGGKYGVDGAGKLSKQDAEKYRSDPKIQAGMLAEFTRENIAKGRKLGGTDDAANVFAYHNLGDGDAGRILKAVKNNPETSVRDALVGGREVSDSERLRIEAVIKNNKSLYGDGTISAGVAYNNMGNKMRMGEFFAQDARAMQAKSTMPSLAMTPQTPAVPNISAVPNIPTAPAIAKMPDIPEIASILPATQLNARPSNASVTVVAPKSDVGQDLRDRKIAHIVTGGMSVGG
ncbi:MAG: hypothetical protein JWQ61_2838 [Collimonas fungivorans]|uniref:hypothetical protein n=1 Tax=Collimonas fungivorans TaxID=158899 RepID=UPI0026EA4342|nr:hypothetical protein [Collimonas fungivorans]MDB5768024.1 hypothetical protein [Collimonas fungivorans]